jgi:HD superfamily phosphohydrolase YqeK
MNLPTLSLASHMMQEAEQRNPGPWVQHSRYVAQAAELIASRHPRLDPETAYLLGYLHDIGRREGRSDLRHTLDGYQYLVAQGYPDAAQICLTHSFTIKDLRVYSGNRWDCTPEEIHFLEEYLAKVEYSDYDRLIQLCDALCLPTGFCLIEKRFVDVALRYGMNECSVSKWKAYLQLQKDFEEVIGVSVYRLLPGIIENTFGFDPPT